MPNDRNTIRMQFSLTHETRARFIEALVSYRCDVDESDLKNKKAISDAIFRVLRGWIYEYIHKHEQCEGKPETFIDTRSVPYLESTSGNSSNGTGNSNTNGRSEVEASTSNGSLLKQHNDEINREIDDSTSKLKTMQAKKQELEESIKDMQDSLNALKHDKANSEEIMSEINQLLDSKEV
jgi:hypothetical protein